MSPELARSWLFVPGDRPERFDKAARAGADQVILDLEDAVLPEGKTAARAAVAAWLAAGGRGAVRVNATGTPWFEEDLALATSSGLTALVLPKAESAVLDLLPSGPPVMALIETARGVLEAQTIAASPRVARLMFGSVDFGNDTGAVEGSQVMAAARSALVLASAAAGIEGPADGVSLDLDGGDTLLADTRRAAAEGFTGKLCIHPRQIAAIHLGFAPAEEELARARALVAAAEASPHGALRFDGKLIDRPVLDRAKRLLASI